MKNFLHSRDGASKGAALMIALALVVLLTGLALAYFSRTTTDRQLAQSSYNDTSSDLLARSALDIVVGDFKQEIINNPTITRSNIQPARYGDASIPNLVRRSFSGDPTNRTSSVSSGAVSANGRSISTTRWNSHYLIPRGNPGDTSVNPSPTPTFIAPDWVLVTGQGPAQAPAPAAVVGRYAFAVYDEGGLLDMTVAGYPGWSGLPGCNPSPTPWLVNVGLKGTVGFADLTALGTYAPPQSQIDNIVGWRNYAMTQRTPPPSFGNFSYAGETDCTKQDFYGSYLLYFGDPPFSIDSLSDKLNATLYPFTAAANYMYPTPGPLINSRTDQALTTRQELLKLRSSLGFSQNVLQYMGTFSRERNWPAPDWPNLNPTGALSEGRFNLNNLDIVIPNPDDCLITHGKKKGWQTGKNKNHLCGSSADLINLFGLYWKKADTTTTPPTPGHWIYVAKDPPNGKGKIACLRGPNRQNDFFQILKYALFTIACSGDGDPDPNRLAKTFAIGASLIDEWDSGEQCPSSGNATGQPQGCDLDWRALDNGKWQKRQYTTHTTVIEWGNGGGTFAYGMEKDNRDDSVNGDWPYNDSGCKDCPHRPCGNNGGNCTGSETPGPIPVRGGPTPTQVVNRGFTTVGEFGYGIDTFTGGLPTLKFWDSSTTPPFQYAPVLDFFSYNPVSSAYPRAGIVNLYTKNAPVLAAILSRALETAAAANSNPPSPVVSGTPYAGSEAQRAADAIVAETQRVLAGSPTYGSVQQTDLTRAIAGRLTKAAIDAVPGWPSASDDTKNTVARAIAEIGQTRTWNLLIDVIAQTGKYAPGTTDVTDGTKFTVEGEKRYWLHIALGRDLIQADGTPCAPGVSTGCQVDVLGTQLEEVIDN